jgi:hypothetical protein
MNTTIANDDAQKLDQIFSQTLVLTPLQKAHLVEKVMALLADDLSRTSHIHPRKSLFGTCANFVIALSANDIDKNRRENLTNFPREDIF